MIIRNLKKHLLAIFAFSMLTADAGPKIPMPEISLNKAIEIAKTQLQIDMPESKSEFSHSDMLLIEIRYYSENNLKSKFPTAYKNMKLSGNPKWCWVVTFVQPVANDLSRTYRIDQDGQIKLLYATT